MNFYFAHACYRVDTHYYGVMSRFEDLEASITRHVAARQEIADQQQLEINERRRHEEQKILKNQEDRKQVTETVRARASEIASYLISKEIAPRIELWHPSELNLPEYNDLLAESLFYSSGGFRKPGWEGKKYRGKDRSFAWPITAVHVTDSYLRTEHETRTSSGRSWTESYFYIRGRALSTTGQLYTYLSNSLGKDPSIGPTSNAQNLPVEYTQAHFARQFLCIRTVPETVFADAMSDEEIMPIRFVRNDLTSAEAQLSLDRRIDGWGELLLEFAARELADLTNFTFA